MVCERSNGSDRALEKKLLKLLKEEKENIKMIIDNDDLLSDNITLSQLEFIHRQLKLMEESMNPKEYMPTYSRIIVDSWDYNSELGIKLLDIFEKYTKIT